MRIADLSEEMWELLFSVRVCSRYHERRSNFFLTVHRVTTVVRAIFGAAVVIALCGTLGRHLGFAIAGLVTAMSVLDIVVGCSDLANVHRDLRCRFVELEQAIIDDHSEARLGELQRRRLEIEKDEPFVLRALATLVQNEQVLAEYSPGEASQHLVRVGLWQRFSAHFFSHSNDSYIK